MYIEKRTLVDESILRTVESVRVEDCNRDAERYTEVIEDVVLTFISEHRVVGISSDELSTLVGDCRMSHEDARAQLVAEEAWLSVLMGWRPEGYEPSDVAGYYTYVDHKRYPLSWADIVDIGQYWEIALTVTRRKG